MKTEKEKALEKILRFCAYQERCSSEVRKKLSSYGLSENDTNEILNLLLSEQFVDDGRFAEMFVRGKANMKGWGVNKIRYALMVKGIDSNIVAQALSTIDKDKYYERLKEILKSKTISDSDPISRRAKLVRYGVSKGYQSGLVWKAIGELGL